MRITRNILMALCALWLLWGCGADKGERLQQLEMLEQMNRADSVMENDSLAEDLVAYFDKHGTPNERMRARYILGRTYADMGEAPRAIDSYQDAIDAADTTANDFDFYLLCCVYSQMAEIYHSQLLLTDEIEAQNKASHYALRANKIQWAIYNQAMSAGAYILLNKKDSAEIILKSALEQYRKHGFTQQALRYSRSLMHLYTESPQRLEEAKILMDQFESESDLFDEHHELPPSQRQYYYYKGMYFEGIKQLDSAEYYYRKMYYPDMPFVAQDPMFRGLLSVFSKRHQADSIAKYAQLYCMANDSSIALKDRDVVAQMSASYNYSRFQKEAHENDIKAYNRLIVLIIIAIILGIIVLAAFLKWKSYKRKINKLKSDFADASDRYEENLRKIKLLESTHRQVIATIQEETRSQVSQDYEREKSRLLEENEELQKQIVELQRNEAISKYLSASEAFANEEIVKEILKMADDRLSIVKEEKWNDLTKVFANSYPVLFRDLSKHFDTPQHIRVCILTVIGLSGDEQANVMNIKKQRVSNSKSAINKALFKESSSRTLYKNLVARYNIYRIGKIDPLQ